MWLMKAHNAVKHMSKLILSAFEQYDVLAGGKLFIHVFFFNFTYSCVFRQAASVFFAYISLSHRTKYLYCKSNFSFNVVNLYFLLHISGYQTEWNNR